MTASRDRDRTPARSQHPGPVDADASVVTQADTTAREPTHLDAVAYVASLRARFTVKLTDADRATFERTITPDKARRLGVTHGALDVFNECGRCLTAYATLITAKRLIGYGPLRAAFLIEKMGEMAPQLDAHATQRSVATQASSSARGVQALSRDQRRLALRALRNLIADDAGLRARLAEAIASPIDRQTDVALRRIAVEVAYVREHTSARVLDDAGLTAAVLDGLLVNARSVSGSRTSARDARHAAQLIRGGLAGPCGQLLHELRALLGSARDSRASDPTLPEVTSWLVTHRPKSAPAPSPLVVPPDAPR